MSLPYVFEDEKPDKAPPYVFEDAEPVPKKPQRPGVPQTQAAVAELVRQGPTLPPVAAPQPAPGETAPVPQLPSAPITLPERVTRAQTFTPETQADVSELVRRGPARPRPTGMDVLRSTLALPVEVARAGLEELQELPETLRELPDTIRALAKAIPNLPVVQAAKQGRLGQYLIESEPGVLQFEGSDVPRVVNMLNSLGQVWAEGVVIGGPAAAADITAQAGIRGMLRSAGRQAGAAERTLQRTAAQAWPGAAPQVARMRLAARQARATARAPSAYVFEPPAVAARPGAPAVAAAVTRRVELPAVEAAPFVRGPGSQAFQEVAKRVKGAEVSGADVVDYISRAFDVPVRIKRFPTQIGPFRAGQVAGLFKTREEVIRVRKSLNMDTLSHELGHLLDKRHRLTQTPQLQELMPIFGTEIAQAGYPPGAVPAELVANFVNFWFRDPEAMRRAAPQFTEFFEKSLKGNFGEWVALQRAQHGVQRWYAQAPEARILGAIAEPERSQVSLGHFLEQRFVDQGAPLRRFMDQVRKASAGAPIPPSRDAYKLYRLAQRQASAIGRLEVWTQEARTNRVGTKVGPALAEIFAPIGADYREWKAYAIARRAKELQQRGIQTGFLESDLNAVIGRHQSERFDKALREFVDWQNAALDEMAESYGFSKGLIERIKELNADYLPFWRAFERPSGGGLPHGFADLPNPLRRIKGSERPLLDPVETAVKNVGTYLSLAEANRVGQAVVRWGDRLERMGKYVEHVPTPVRPVKINIGEVVELIEQKFGLTLGKDIGKEFTEDLLTQFVTLWRPIGGVPKENILTVWRGGRPVAYQVSPELFEAMKALDSEHVSFLEKVMAFPASTLRAGAILSPDFLPRNPMRDQIHAFIRAEHGFVPFVDMFGGLFHMAKRDDLYLRWLSSGAASSTLQGLDRRSIQRLVENMANVTRLKKDKTLVDFYRTRPLVLRPIEFLRVVSDTGEQATRLGAARRAFPEAVRRGLREPTLDEFIEFALAGRGITTDFWRAGSVGRRLNRVSAFWNARMQGWSQDIESFRRNPKRFTIRSIVGITLPTVVLYGLNRDDPRYQTAPTWVKNAFWLVPIGDQMVPYPKPPGVGQIFGSAVEFLLDWLDNEDPKAVDAIMQEFVLQELQQTVPIPTALLPIFEVWMNYDTFRDQQIVPEGTSDLEPGPSTPHLTTAVARLFQAGAEKGIPTPAILQSPRRLQHLVRSYFGGLGRAATEIPQLARGALRGEFPTAAEVPGLRTFVYDPYRQSKDIEDFYQELRRLRTERTRQEDPERMPRGFTVVERRLRDIRAEMREIDASSITLDQKRAARRRLFEEMVNLAREALGRPPIRLTKGE